MRIRFWRCPPTAPMPPSRRTPEGPPAWATAPTEVFPACTPGRTGNLTRAQAWRAGGWRRNAGRW